jgi:pSer/pThr/pTyr-binding forkhead associated (FHA) protein
MASGRRSRDAESSPSDDEFQRDDPTLIDDHDIILTDDDDIECLNEDEVGESTADLEWVPSDLTPEEEQEAQDRDSEETTGRHDVSKDLSDAKEDTNPADDPLAAFANNSERTGETEAYAGSAGDEPQSMDDDAFDEVTGEEATGEVDVSETPTWEETSEPEEEEAFAHADAEEMPTKALKPPDGVNEEEPTPPHGVDIPDEDAQDQAAAAELELEPVGRRRQRRRCPVRPESDAEPAPELLPWEDDGSETRPGDVDLTAVEAEPGPEQADSDDGGQAEDERDSVRWSALPGDQPKAMPDVGPTRVDLVNPPEPAESAQAFGQSTEAPGDKTLIFDDPSGPEGQEQEEVPFLLIIEGDEEGREIELLRDELTMGRGPDNDLVFPDIACSRHHALLERQGDDWVVVDLGSGNGTLVNAASIKRGVLRDGDEVEVGNTVFQYNDPSAAGAASDDWHTPPPSSTTVTGASPLDDEAPEGLLTRLTADPKHRKILIIGGAALGGLILLMIIIKLAFPSGPAEPTPDGLQRQEAMQKRREFDKHLNRARSLVVDKKWKDALLEVQLAKGFDPKSQLIEDYLVTVQREMSSASALEQGRMFLEQKNWDSAVAALSRIPSESEYHADAEALKKQIDGQIVDALLKAGREKMKAGEFNQALLKFDDVVRRDPDNRDIAFYKRQCKDKLQQADRDRRRAQARKDRRKKRRRRTKTERKTARSGLTGQVLALYRNGEIDRAINKAETSGSSQNVALLKKFRGAYSLSMQLAKQPGQIAKALNALKKALSFDKQISGGSGKYGQQLNTVVSKVYFVKGVDSNTRHSYPEAYQAFKAALRHKPDHALAKGRLKELEKIAKKKYEEAYVIKANNAEQAVEQLNIVMKIIPVSHVYYGKAKRLKGRIQGPLGGDDSGGSGF